MCGREAKLQCGCSLPNARIHSLDVHRCMSVAPRFNGWYIVSALFGQSPILTLVPITPDILRTHAPEHQPCHNCVDKNGAYCFERRKIASLALSYEEGGRKA